MIISRFLAEILEPKQSSWAIIQSIYNYDIQLESRDTKRYWKKVHDVDQI